MKIFAYVLITASILHVSAGFDFFDWGKNILDHITNFFNLPNVLVDKEWQNFKSHFEKSFHIFEELYRCLSY